jgi:tetratricopeptide (TPR) repeat protein
MDCVSVCPKDALYVGFGLPAVLAPDRRAPSQRPAPTGPAARKAALDGFLRTLVLAAFVAGALTVLMQFDAPLDGRLLWITSAVVLVCAVLFRGRSKRSAGYAWHEEALLGAAFLASLWSLRGFQGMVPLLFALGLSAILAWALLQAVRALTGRASFVQGRALVQNGRPTGTGVVFASCLLPLLALWGWAGTSRWSEESAARAAEAAFEEGMRRAYDDDLAGALASFERAVERRPEHLLARVNLAGMLCSVGRFEEGVAQYELVLERRDDPGTRRLLARALRELGRSDAAAAEERAAEQLERR